MRVVVAPDSFKGTIGAAEAANALADGWLARRPGDTVRSIPQADGGEGTLDVIAAAVPGATLRSAGPVEGPDSRLVDGVWLELPDGTAVVELARTSGLTLLERPDPLGAHTRGLGQVIAAAIDSGCSRLIVGVGGSASTDGGRAAVSAIGVRRPPPEGATVLVDVRNPLLGPRGAAAVYGPQKGATEQEVAVLERRLAAFARTVGHDPGVAGSGAAGGTAYGLLAWGARLVEGAAALAELSGLKTAARNADLVITGEGRFDAQSMSGKVVSAVLALGAPVTVVAGSVEGKPSVPALSLAELAGSVEDAMSRPAQWLRSAGRILAERASA